MVGSTQKRKFLHDNVKTGQYVTYAVRARRTDAVSKLCASMAIYAPKSSNPLVLSKAA